MLGLGLSLIKGAGKNVGAFLSYIKDSLKLYYRFYDNDPELLLSGATSFDGDDDYIDCGASVNDFSSGNFTISVWLKHDTSNSNHAGIVAIRSGQATELQLYIHATTNKLGSWNGSDNVFSTGTISNDIWTHCVLIQEEGNKKFYINGLLDSTQSQARGSANSATFKIGYTGYSSEYFEGSIANVGIWNRALSASEIESIYWKGQYADLKGTELTNLVSWYNLSADANDSTGTNNGTNNGATFLTDAYSASSPFLPRIQDKATPKGAVALASGSSSFDGSDDYISFPFQESGSYTISAWFKLDVVQTSIVVNWGDQATGERRSLLIWNGGSGGYKVYSSTYGSNIAGSTVLSAGVWYHASVTVDVSDGSAKIYLNGSLDGSGTNTINSFTGTTGEIGRQPGGEYFEGSLANVAIYSDVKTQSQIQDIMFSSYSTLKEDLGANLITNSTMEVDDNWNNHNTPTTNERSTEVVLSGTYSRKWIGNGAGDGIKSDTFSVVAGVTYKITFNFYIHPDSTAPILLRMNDGNGSNLGGSVSNSDEGQWISKTFYRTAENTGSSSYVYIYQNGGGATTCYIDDVTVKAIGDKDGKTNLVSWYDLGTNVEDSHGSNNGTNNGATINTGYTASPSGVADPLNYGEVYGGNAVSFDGVNDYIDLVNSVEWQKPKAISMWFKATSISSHGSNVYNKDTLIGYGNVFWGVQLDVNKKIQYYFYDGSARSWLTDSTITLSKWHHIAVVSDGDSSQIFLDGQSIGSNSLTWDDNTGGTSEQLRLGGAGFSSTQPFTGSMSHVQVFSEALTQDQVRELYTKPELTLPTGIASSALKLDMPMQEGSGTAILDGSPVSKNIYESDFSSGVDGWAVKDSFTGVSGNVDDIGGLNDNLRMFSSTSTGSTRYIKNTNTVTSGKPYRITFSYYIPSTNTDLDAISIEGTRFTTTDAWTDADLIFTASENELRIYLADADDYLNPSTDGDSAYVRNIDLYEIGQNHGTGNGITWATGQEYGFQHPLVRSNNPMVFDGSNDYVDCGTGLGNDLGDNYSGSLSMSMWFKADTTSSNDGLFHIGSLSSESGEFEVQMYNNTLRFRLSNTVWWRQYDFTDTSSWHHLVCIYDTNSESNSKMYIDGVSVGSTNGTFPSDADMDFNGLKTIIGSFFSTSLTFDGMINEVAVWDSALTANEVTALYNSGLPLLPTTDSGNYASSSDLVGYWRNDGVTTWLDRSTNSNNGTVSGSPASIIVPEGLNEGRDSQGYYLTDTDSISSGIRLKGAEYISVQDSETLSFGNGTSDTPFSLEAWIKPNDVTNFPALAKGVYNSAGEYLFGFLSVDKLKFYLFNNSAFQAVAYDTALTSSEGQWMHIVATYDGRGGTSANAGMKIYLNGSQVNNANESSGTYVAMENLSANLEVGKYSSNYAKGSIDEAKVYSKELSATEVLKNYNNGKSAH